MSASLLLQMAAPDMLVGKNRGIALDLSGDDPNDTRTSTPGGGRRLRQVSVAVVHRCHDGSERPVDERALRC